MLEMQVYYMSTFKNMEEEDVRRAIALNYVDMPLQVTHSRSAALHPIPDLSVRNGLNSEIIVCSRIENQLIYRVDPTRYKYHHRVSLPGYS